MASNIAIPWCVAQDYPFPSTGYGHRAWLRLGCSGKGPDTYLALLQRNISAGVRVEANKQLMRKILRHAAENPDPRQVTSPRCLNPEMSKLAFL